ncbi:hypothetical protein ACU8MP_02390 [Rhizobium leguminosarum]|uniref:Uncharacterized protein n=1 Tax=Rhizobium leguminosarum TaxID=384 RepID=A0A6P0DJP8_RHILE|nr:hypothetical protein [Rhizobium leguminosarum]ASS54326.1 hypothetical protein CHR56_06915 [Rhizobium leguminosarum bv. viciae]MBB4333229.1 hypothetical protein [Rhizobium leguminosarum]MBB4346169.1 hypothetical protein [Rhizobium leguminosarum]MBB4358906.1 hypothetical protein [Rhizobium leguminosarum]MBB4477410.1 hypothetical protein [Rhizobium leguminosarum]
MFWKVFRLVPFSVEVHPFWDAVYSRVEQEQRKELMRHDLDSSWRQLFRDYSVKRPGHFADGVGRQRDDLVGWSLLISVSAF